MYKRAGFLLIVIMVFVIMAGCTSSTGSKQLSPTPDPAQLAAMDKMTGQAGNITGVQGRLDTIITEVNNASFRQPPSLNQTVVNNYQSDVDGCIMALNDYKAANNGYKIFLEPNGSEYTQVEDNGTAGQVLLNNATRLEKELKLVGVWLNQYDVWMSANDSAQKKVDEMNYFASLTDPLHQATPDDGVRYFNSAGPAFTLYFKEGEQLTRDTDNLTAVMEPGKARDSLIESKKNILTYNDWLKSQYNLMVSQFNSITKGRFGQISQL